VDKQTHDEYMYIKHDTLAQAMLPEFESTHLRFFQIKKRVLVFTRHGQKVR